jgi:hypothetical protein
LGQQREPAPHSSEDPSAEHVAVARVMQMPATQTAGLAAVPPQSVSQVHDEPGAAPGPITRESGRVPASRFTTMPESGRGPESISICGPESTPGVPLSRRGLARPSQPRSAINPKHKNTFRTPRSLAREELGRQGVLPAHI